MNFELIDNFMQVGVMLVAAVADREHPKVCVNLQTDVR